MEFNQLVSEKLVPIFLGHKFSISEETKNYFRFKSNAVEASVSFNPRDRSCLFIIGRKNNTLYEIGDPTIKDFLRSDIKLCGLGMEYFVGNLSKLLQTSLLSILLGDKISLRKFEIFKLKEAHEYTLKISNRDKNETAKLG